MIVYDKLHKQYGFSSSQLKILELVGSNKRVLEIGSSTGYMTKALKEGNNIVDVIEVDVKAARSAKKYAQTVVVGSIEDKDTLKKLERSAYDFIIMADVLEHLVNPEIALKNLLKVSDSFTKLIVSLPNIASWPMRKKLFFNGDFTYQESGLLDNTHLHFYTVNTLPKLLEQTGWSVKNLVGTIKVLPFDQKISSIPVLGYFFVKLIRPFIADKFKNLAYYHFVTLASKK